jgi:hypothetical protein
MSIKKNNYFWENIYDYTSIEKYENVCKINNYQYYYVSENHITIASSPYRAINYTNTWFDKFIRIDKNDLNHISEEFSKPSAILSYKSAGHLDKIELMFDNLDTRNVLLKNIKQIIS